MKLAVALLVGAVTPIVLGVAYECVAEGDSPMEVISDVVNDKELFASLVLAGVSSSAVGYAVAQA